MATQFCIINIDTYSTVYKNMKITFNVQACPSQNALVSVHCDSKHDYDTVDCDIH